MTDKVKIKEWISKTQDGLMDANGNFGYPEHEGAYNVLCNLDAYIDSLQEESPTVYVITRCEEHSDYVEKVFLDYNKAIDYCRQFEGKEDEYGRDITKIEVTL